MIDPDPPVAPLPLEPAPPFFHAQPLLAGALFSVAVLGGFVVLGGPVQLFNLAAGVWFTELVIFFGATFALLQIFGSDPVRETGLDSTTPRAVALGFLLGLVNYLAWAVPLMGTVERLMPRWVLELFNSSQIFRHQAGLELAVVVLGLGFAAPFGEEFFFRGVLQKALGERMAPPRAIVITALIFSAFHLDPVGFFARFELGVLFGLLAWRSGSIWPGVAAHAANNLIATALFFASSSDDVEAEIPWWALLACLLVGNVLLALVVRLAMGRLESPRPAERHDIPPVSVGRAVWPWLAGSLLALGLVFAVDWRGVQLRAFEVANPMPKAAQEDQALEALRVKARSGQVPLQDYFDAWKLQRPSGQQPQRKE